MVSLRAAGGAIANELEVLILDMEKFTERLRALARQPGVDSRTPSSARDGRQRFEVAVDAFRRHHFPFDDLKVRRICQKHAQDSFAVNLGVWHVRLPDFDHFAERVKGGLVRF